jgi:serine/threonine protein kinase
MPSKGEKVKDYTLKERIGGGSYGEVWLAEKKIEFSDKGIQCALKFLAGEDGRGWVTTDA